MRYGLVGHPIAHCFSPQLHRALSGLSYELFDLPEKELLPLLRRRDIGGLDIAHPYRRLALSYCDKVSETAQKCGSVNTLVLEQDRSISGYNTDYTGFLALVKASGIRFAGRKVLICGTGTTSQTVALAAQSLGAAWVIRVSRTKSPTYENLDRYADAQIIINATPIGMAPDWDGKPLDLTRFPRCEGVLDVVCYPLRTALMLQATELNISAAGGLYMLAAQAAAADELFGRKPVCLERLGQAYADLRREQSNLVLCGMPGSGKSVVGQALAAVLGRTFVDTNEWVEQQTGMLTAAFLAARGQSAFRALERKAVEVFAHQPGLVIALGAGAPLLEENRRALLQNGRIYLLERPLVQLTGQPDAQTKNLQALEQEWMPVLRSFADQAIPNTASITSTVRAIRKDFQKTEWQRF